MQMRREGFNIEPLVAFLEQLMMNPSHRAVEELYGFLEAGNMPITEDGHFLAYKRVNANWTDVHSGTFDNSPGQICEMPRNKVNDDKRQTCSTGLHFCSLDYLKAFMGARIVILKINPADVVSIPTDYNQAKGRCCKYEVIGEYKGGVANMDTPAFTKSVESPANYETHKERGIDLTKVGDTTSAVKSPRKQLAFETIAGMLIDFKRKEKEENEYYSQDEIEIFIDDLTEDVRKAAVDKIIDVMDVTRSTAGEYWRAFKKTFG
jgi:hypothetical protein